MIEEFDMNKIEEEFDKWVKQKHPWIDEFKLNPSFTGFSDFGPAIVIQFNIPLRVYDYVGGVIVRLLNQELTHVKVKLADELFEQPRPYCVHKVVGVYNPNSGLGGVRIQLVDVKIKND